MKALIAVSLLLALLLTACGGGGGNNNGSGSNPPPSTTGAAQGVYSGTSNTGYTFEAIILPNDKLYAIYGTMSGSSLLIYGMIAGQGASSATAYTGSYTDYYYTGATYSGSINATFAAGSSFNGSFTEVGNLPATFTGTPTPSSTFNTTPRQHSRPSPGRGQVSSSTAPRRP